MSVNGVAAWQILWRLARRKHIFAADRTVVLVLVLEAVMTMEDIDADTHAALPAMSEGLYATNSAETTFVAMEGFLRFSHPQVAYIAVVFSEDCSAADADIAVETKHRIR